MPEKPNSVETNRANRAKLLFDELGTALKNYKSGAGDIGELTNILNELQRMTFEKLQRDGKITNTISYDDYAVSGTTVEDDEEKLYSQLGTLHPIIMRQELTDEFNRWLLNLRAAYPLVDYPEIGTKSDLFKITLKHLCGRFSSNLSHTIISDIHLQYILKAELNEDQFIEAHKLIMEGLIL